MLERVLLRALGALRRQIHIPWTVVSMSDLSLLRENAENGTDGGIRRRVGQFGHHLGDGGPTTPEQNIHDLALTTSERFVRTMGRHQRPLEAGVLIFQHRRPKVKGVRKVRIKRSLVALLLNRSSP